MKKFILKCVLAVGIVFCLLFYLDMMYEQKENSFLGELNDYNFVPDVIRVANVGSSHGQCAFYWNAIDSDKSIGTFNFALSSQSYAYDYALLRMYEDQLSYGGLMFIPVSYFSFNEETINDAEREAVSVRYYRLLSPWLNPDYSLYTDLVSVRLAVLSAGEDLFTLAESPILLPTLSENSANVYYTQYLPSLSANQASYTISGNAEAASFNTSYTPAPDAAGEAAGEETGTGTAGGDTADAADNTDTSAILSSEEYLRTSAALAEVYGEDTVASFQERGLSRYQRHFVGKEEYFEEEKKQDLKSLIEYCLSRGVTPVLITTPYTYFYNAFVSDEFLCEFYDTIEEIATECGISYYDYSHDERLQNSLEYYGDADHLNQDGAILFTELIAGEVPELAALLEEY